MSNALSLLVALPNYRETRQHIFPSQGSLDWFVRRNRDGLVKVGALLLVAGRWKVHEERFDQFVLEAGARAAQRPGVLIRD